MSTPTTTPTQPPEVTTHSISINVGTYDDIPFEFTYRTDGTGSCRDVHYGSENISFTWDPSILDDPETQIEEVLEGHANEIFWDEINDQLDDDRVLQDGDFGNEEVSFESGTSEELERIVQLAAYCFSEIWDDSRDEIEVTIRARTDNEEACVEEYYGFMDDADIPDETKETLRQLIDLSLNWIDLYGWSLEYNDGAHGRASGYSESAATVMYTVPRPSFHELAEAREELIGIFAAHDLQVEATLLLPEGG